MTVEDKNTWEQLWLSFDKGETPASLSIVPDFLQVLTINDQVLDVGCGSGRFTRKLSTLVKSVIGMDINMKEIIYRASDDKDHTSIHYCVSDGTALPFQSHFFTTTILLGVLGGVHPTFRSQLLKESFRCLQTGGKIYISEFLQIENQEWKNIYDREFNKTSEWGSITAKAINGKKFHTHHFSKKELDKLLVHSGFTNIDFKTYRVVSQTAEGKEYDAIGFWATK